MFYLELIILIITLSLDTLIAGFSLGIEKIKISIISIIILNIISTLFLLLAFILGIHVIKFIPYNIINYLPSIIFILLGTEKLLENFKHKTNINKNSSNISNIFQMYKHPKKADLDNSKTISLKELILLAISLSFDNFLIGISLTDYNNYLIFITIFHFLFGFIFFYILNRISIKIHINKLVNSSIISGSIFIIVGIYRIFS